LIEFHMAFSRLQQGMKIGRQCTSVMRIFRGAVSREPLAFAAERGRYGF
jgi:hypothetical protein